jgi:two-component system, NtrC family, sensor histidine kinase PilS
MPYVWQAVGSPYLSLPFRGTIVPRNSLAGPPDSVFLRFTGIPSAQDFLRPTPRLVTPISSEPLRPSAIWHGALAPASADTRVAWEALLYFSAYRVLLAILIGLVFWRFNDLFAIGLTTPAIAVVAVVVYLVVSPILAIGSLIKQPALSWQIAAHVFVDIAVLGTLMHASGGARSGLGLLLLITVAAVALMSRGRVSLFYAACAACFILVEQTYQFTQRDGQAAELLQGALLAIGYFVVALVGYNLSRYATVSQRVAEAAGLDLANMAAVNELVVRDMQDGYVLVDERLQARHVNPAAWRLLGIDPVALLPGSPLPMLASLSEELAERVQDWREDPTPERSRIRTRLGDRDVVLRFVEIGSSQKPATVVFVDNLDHARAEAQKIKLASLGRLSASIAHEIRNPLSAMSHAAELMLEAPNRESGDTRLVTIIRDNVHRLDRLVEEVLYLNRRDRTKPERIRLPDYLASFIDNFCTVENVPRATFYVQCESDSPMLFDRGHLDQILWNLVRNAWRHCQKRAESIVLHVAREPGGLIALEVSDDGPGVAESSKANLFEPFFTTDSKGTGLGLYVARELAHANGGELEYIAPPGGGGALFRLSAPYESAGAPPSRRADSP